MEGFTIAYTVWRAKLGDLTNKERKIVDKRGWEIASPVERRFHLLLLKYLFIFKLRYLNAKRFFHVVSEPGYNYRL